MSIGWHEIIHRFFHVHLPETTATIKQGIYHYRRETDGNATRFHLRVEDDGSGLLLANASIAARLSPSGVLIAKSLLEGRTLNEIRATVHKNFRAVKEEQLQPDIARLRSFIETLANPEDNYPIFNLDDPALLKPRHLPAPFHAQMLVASAEENHRSLQKLWESGIIHVTFSARKSSSPREAILNIEKAEDLGMISGLRGVASWVQTPDLLRSAALAGVDYVTVPMLAPSAEKHDGYLGPGDFAAAVETFKECKALEVCPVAEIPLIQPTFDEIPQLLEMLKSYGVRNVLYYAIAGDHQPLGMTGMGIIQAAMLVHELAHTSDVRYVWQPPISSPRDLKSILEEGPRTAGDISVRVEPDGSVYPSRGPSHAAGNLKSESWESIWNNEVFRNYRNRLQAPTRCEICPDLEICAADCPADPRGWSVEGR